jgi:hypothetical protein
VDKNAVVVVVVVVDAVVVVVVGVPWTPTSEAKHATRSHAVRMAAVWNVLE